MRTPPPPLFRSIATWRLPVAHVRATFALLAVAACGEREAAQTEAVAVRDSAGVSIVDQDLTELTNVCTIDAEPSVSIGVEEGEQEYMLSQLNGAVRLSDGRIVIAQGSTDDIRYYAPDGTFIRTAGRAGQGPGEFSEPFYMTVLPGDTIYVGDYRPWQFLVFDENGEWVRTVRPMPLLINPPSPARVLANGELILGEENRRSDAPPATFPMRTISLQRYAQTGELRDTLGIFDNARYGQVKQEQGALYVFPLFESFAQFAVRGNHIVTGHGRATELRVHRADSAFTLERIVRWNDGPRDISAADIDAERETTRARYANMPPERVAMMVEPLVSEQQPVAEQFPAFSQLHMGTDQRLWIREQPRPRDTTDYKWISFAPDGAFDCRMTTPRFAQFYEFGPDYVLVRDADSLDVDRVRVYPLRKR